MTIIWAVVLGDFHSLQPELKVIGTSKSHHDACQEGRLDKRSAWFCLSSLAVIVWIAETIADFEVC